MNGIVRKYIVCLFFSFDLLLLVWLSEMIRMMIVEITSGSNPYTLSNLSIFLLWIFGIVPAILLSVWLINPLSIKKLLSTFDLTEKSLDKKKEKTDVQQPEKTKDSKTSEKQTREEREFQLEMLRIQLFNDSFNSIMTTLIAIGISWIIAMLAISFSNVPPELRLLAASTAQWMFYVLVVAIFVIILISLLVIPRYYIKKLREHFIEK